MIRKICVEESKYKGVGQRELVGRYRLLMKYICFNQFKPLSGSLFILLPTVISNKKANLI